MVKYKSEAALDYVKELEFKPAKNSRQLEKLLRNKLGNQTTEELILFFDERARAQENGDDTDSNAFYDVKNDNFEKSMAITSIFDGYIIRSFCEWIDNHKNLFEGRILEVGCDNGVISCFLGKLFPDSEILSIDRNKAAIKNAIILKEKLGINNVTFLDVDLAGIDDSAFDTVFSARTMHENFSHFVGTCIDAPLEEHSENCKELVLPYAKQLARCVKDGGNLISIERSGVNPLICGWMEAINECKFNIIDTIEKITCIEAGGEGEFQAMVARKCKTQEDRDVILEKYAEAMFGENVALPAQSYSHEAQAYLYLFKKDLIAGYNGYEGDKRIARIVLWENKYDETSILAEQYDGNENVLVLTNLNMEQRDEHVEFLEKEISNYRKQGYVFKKITVENGKEVEQ